MTDWKQIVGDRLTTPEDAVKLIEDGDRVVLGMMHLKPLQLCRARAFVADPAILVLDEATSSLDPETENIIDTAIRRLLQGRTSIVIAHRLSTAEHADRVLLLDHGCLVEDGSHDDLIARDGHYAALHRQWRTGTEPAPDPEAD